MWQCAFVISFPSYIMFNDSDRDSVAEFHPGGSSGESPETFFINSYGTDLDYVQYAAWDLKLSPLATDYESLDSFMTIRWLKIALPAHGMRLLNHSQTSHCIQFLSLQAYLDSSQVSTTFTMCIDMYLPDALLQCVDWTNHRAGSSLLQIPTRASKSMAWCGSESTCLCCISSWLCPQHGTVLQAWNSSVLVM